MLIITVTMVDTNATKAAMMAAMIIGSVSYSLLRHDTNYLLDGTYLKSSFKALV